MLSDIEMISPESFCTKIMGLNDGPYFLLSNLLRTYFIQKTVSGGHYQAWKSTLVVGVKVERDT